MPSFQTLSFENVWNQIDVSFSVLLNLLYNAYLKEMFVWVSALLLYDSFTMKSFLPP